MKKHILLLIMALALMPWQTFAQSKAFDPSQPYQVVNIPDPALDFDHGGVRSTGLAAIPFQAGRYTYTEQLYYASDLTREYGVPDGKIRKIAWRSMGGNSTTHTIDIYMRNVSAVCYTGSGPFLYVTDADKVYTGTVSYPSSGWMEVELNTAFQWDGESTLLIATRDRTKSDNTNAVKWAVFRSTCDADGTWNANGDYYRAYRSYGTRAINDLSNPTVNGNNDESISVFNAQVRLTFQKLTFSVDAYAAPAAGGTVNGASSYSNVFDEDEECTLLAEPNPGYVFVNWTENGVEVSNSDEYTFDVTSHRYLMANFESANREITATVDPAGAGTVTGAGTYEKFSTCTLTATANSGYAFVNWTENGTEVSTDNPYSFVVTDDRALVANFVPTVITFTNDDGDNDWANPLNWSTGNLPTVSDDVVITDEAHILDGTVATAGTITLEGGIIIIEEGGELIHGNTGVVATMEKGIIAYQNPYGKDNYYLIALPFDSYTISGSPLIAAAAGNYNLYTFDGAYPQAEWRGNPTAIANGVGFLYANDEGGTLSFEGELVPGNANQSFELAYNTEAVLGTWNLVGNPFACSAMPSIADYYAIDGEVLAATSGAVAPLNGIFVTSSNEVRGITFTPGTGAKRAEALNIRVNKINSRSISLVDLARIRFEKGVGLEKFMLNPNQTKIYITMDGKDYAVVYADAVGEMPVSFKAEENGRYTIAVDAEEVSFSYLHLIDNRTGADVDLLATPYYSFDAATTDYESRFKVVFATNGDNDAETFAFSSNGQWVINNEGDATLQVMDMTGRVLSSEAISGAVSKSIDAAQGIYMLRLINGDNVRVQKIVVR